MTTMTKKLLIKEALILWLPVVFWMAVIFFFSSIQTPPVSQIYFTEFVVKKSAHVVEYFILCLLFYRGFLGSGISKKTSIYFAFFLSMAYASLDEFHQSFTPGREPKLRDVLIDTVASGLAVLFVARYLPKSPVKIQKLAKDMKFLR